MEQAFPVPTRACEPRKASACSCGREDESAVVAKEMLVGFLLSLLTPSCFLSNYSPALTTFQ